MPGRRRAYSSASAPSQSQLGLIGARLCVQFGISPREAAKQLGGTVSHQTIRTSCEILAVADPTTIARIEQGAATVHGVKNTKRSTRTVGVSLDQYDRLQAMSQRTGVTMQALAATALETFLTLGERAATADEEQSP